MKIRSQIFTAGLLSTSLFLVSCQESGNSSDKDVKINDTAVASAAGKSISLAPVTGSPEFPGAALSMGKVTSSASGDSSRVTFNFNVKNYALKAQTSDGATKMCNNSKDGQHIHFILNNAPYKALYEPKNEIVLPLNTEHYLLAFLSRSYHEALKNKEAALLYHFKIDENGDVKVMEAPTTPMIFYSRPKGDYVGADVENVLLDYYVWNATISPDAYKVKARITGTALDTTLVFDKWDANFIKNLPLGKNSITLSLMDKDGKEVEGTNTKVTREFILSAQEPLQ